MLGILFTLKQLKRFSEIQSGKVRETVRTEILKSLFKERFTKQLTLDQKEFQVASLKTPSNLLLQLHQRKSLATLLCSPPKKTVYLSLHIIFPSSNNYITPVTSR